jgi:O-antigen ligase
LFFAVLAFACILVIDIKWGLYVLLLLVPVGESYIAFWFDARWSKMGTVVPLFVPFILIVLIVETTARMARIRSAAVHSPFTPIFILLLCWAFLSLFWSPNIHHYLIKFLVLSANVYLFYLYVNAINSEGVHRKIIWFCIIFGLVIAVDAISFIHYPLERTVLKFPVFGEVTLNIYNKFPEYRAASIANPNSTSLSLNFSIALIIGMLLTVKDKFKSILLFGMLIVLLYANLLTGSKGGFLSLIGMAGFLLFSMRGLRKNFFKNASLFVLIIVAIFLVQALTTSNTKGLRLLSVLADSNSTNEEMVSSSMRLEMWQEGFSKLIKETNGLGLGVGGFTEYCQHPHAHSIYFSVLFDFGIPGMILLLIGMIILCYYFFSTVKHQETYLQVMSVAIFGGLVAMGIHGFIDHTWSKGYSWLYPSIYVATYYLVKNELSAKTQTVNTVDGSPQDPARSRLLGNNP